MAAPRSACWRRHERTCSSAPRPAAADETIAPTADDLTALVAAYLVVFAINLAPAFMPPTWSILAFFAISFQLPVLPLAVGGAVAASSGRLALALASRRGGRRFLSRDQREDLAALGEWIDTKGRVAAPLATLLYSFGPIPSNQLFMAAGLTTARLTPIVSAFLVGRLLSYTFWVSTARFAVTRLGDLFVAEFQSGILIGIQILTLAVVFVFARVGWRKLLAGRERAPFGARGRGPLQRL